MTDTNSTPDAAESTTTTTPAASPKRSRKRTVLLSGAGILTALVLAGGGVAVGAALADDERDDRDDVRESLSQTSGQTVRGAASADALIDIIESASALTDGVPTAVDAHRDGSWEVQFTTDSGDESEVRVGADGTATVVSTDVADADDSAPTARLDDATVRDLVAAALAAADGTIVHLDVDDNPSGTYEATVLAGNGIVTELSLDASFAVTHSDTDNDD